MRYVLLVIIWISWCTLHSLMIDLAVTEAFRKRFPNGFRYYRIFYNLFAVVSLLPVFIYSSSLKGEPIITWDGPWRIIPVLLGTLSLLLFAAGARRYDFRQFIGLRQLKNEKVCSVLKDDCTLETGGILSVVRHPWYSGGLLVVWARPLDKAAILTNLVLSGYFVVGTILEERKLIALFGQQYEDYQKGVSMLFPSKWIKKLILRQNRSESG